MINEIVITRWGKKMGRGEGAEAASLS